LELAALPIKLNPSGKRIHYYSEMMPTHIINTLESVFPLRSVCHNAVLRLQRHDALHGTNLLATLEVYLMCNNSLMKAANQLFVHKNTMTYRLKSIEKAVEMDLNDPQQRLNILLSCIVLRVLGENNRE
jgi:DNA-binding PucR family transcriptional regulator